MNKKLYKMLYYIFIIIYSSKYDLYTKNNKVPEIENLWTYYENLIEKYIPGTLEW